MTVSAGDSIIQNNAMDHNLPDMRVPLEAANGGSYRDDYVGCLTCHFAHGSAADMPAGLRPSWFRFRASQWSAHLPPSGPTS